MSTFSKFLIGSAILSVLLTVFEVIETAGSFAAEGIPFEGIFWLFIQLTIIQWFFISIAAFLFWMNEKK